MDRGNSTHGLMDGMITIKRVFGFSIGLILVMVCFVVTRVVLFTLLRKNQFDEVPKLRLESPIKAALSLYGKPSEKAESGDFPEASEYGFLVTNRVDVRLWEWRGAVHGITFWAREWEDSARDLQYILDSYGEGLGWDTIEEGYLYRRKDKRVYLHCSAMPWIGVETAAYVDAEAEYKRVHESTK